MTEVAGRTRALRSDAQRQPSPRQVAQRRSEALLRDLLPAEAQTQLLECGYLRVQSPSRPQRTYLIPHLGFVRIVEHGKLVELLCIGPTEPLPPGDIFVMHKLLIEADEAYYLETANHMPAGFAGRAAADYLAGLTPQN
jgi:hypothetical protein